MDEPTTAEVEKLIQEMGLPTEVPGALSDQILKRARQLAEKRGWSVRHALEYLVGLLKQGWSAKKEGGKE